MAKDAGKGSRKGAVTSRARVRKPKAGDDPKRNGTPGGKQKRRVHGEDERRQIHRTHAQAELTEESRLAGGMKRAGAEKQLEGFIDKFEPKHAALIRGARKRLRHDFPSAHELIYDNYNFFVIGYSPTEKPSDSIISIAAAANGVGLCFIRGASLPDPKKILLGSGKQTRFVRLESIDVLSRPEVKALVAAAAADSKTALRPTGRGGLIIRSISTKQKPRRKTARV